MCPERKTEKNDVAMCKGESKMRKIVVRNREKYQQLKKKGWTTFDRYETKNVL